MAYNPCSFDREEYLRSADMFETVSLEDAEDELCEFNEDAEDLAFELAYTRYRLAKAEKLLACALPHVECKTKLQDNIITAIGSFIEP